MFACNKVTSQTEKPPHWWMLVVLCTWHWWQMDRLRSVVLLVILWTWSVWQGFRCNLLLFSGLVSHLYQTDCELSRSLWSLACQSPELLIGRWLAEVLMSWFIPRIPMPRIRMPRLEKPTCLCWVTCGFLGAGVGLTSRITWVICGRALGGLKALNVFGGWTNSADFTDFTRYSFCLYLAFHTLCTPFTHEIIAVLCASCTW